jgi:DNA polymerase-1
MFLFQKLKYKYIDIETIEDYELVLNYFNQDIPSFVTWDTETTGLNIMKDKPFLLSFSWSSTVGNFAFTVDLKLEDYIYIITHIYDEMFRKTNLNFAHNAKYDYHMMINLGLTIPDDILLADGMTVARLTNYADDNQGIGLEALGTAYVDSNAKFAAKAVKDILKDIRKQRRKRFKKVLKEELPKDIRMGDVVKAFDKRVNFLNSEYDEWFELIDKEYNEPNYYDVYLKEPQLMKHYAVDDAVILNEYLKKALPVLNAKQSPETVFKQECELLRPVAEMERVGLRADVDYLIDSHYEVKQYINEVYEELWSMTDDQYGHFSSGQHKVIMEIMEEQFDVVMGNCDAQALTKIIEEDAVEFPHKKAWDYDEEDAAHIEYQTEMVTSEVSPEATAFAELIMQLRTLDKWLSTYIDGMLNRVSDGRIYTSVNNSGAITGRVSSDFQQQPKEPLLDTEGNELFHPRKVIINDEGGKMYFFDFSQMELRLQANYTIEISGGDDNLCKAFIPFKHYSVFSGEKFNPNEDYDRVNTGEWIDEDGEEWKSVDLHDITTIKAFPELANENTKSERFLHYRRYGKVANFLKNYGGGIEAIKSQLGVDDKIAQDLNNGYYKAFPAVLNYQKWVEESLLKYGYVENIYGRRYYIQSRNLFYRGYNYTIQGGCADLVKEKQIKTHKFLKENNLKSKILLPVHDELIIFILDDEVRIIEEIVKILDDNRDKVKYIPMVCDVEFTDTNWADKEDLE